MTGCLLKIMFDSYRTARYDRRYERMRVTDLPEYQSPWLSAPDLQGKAHRRRISEWTIEEVRQRTQEAANASDQ